jgi:N-acetylglucosaminyldiphosphoundecaprenol N-acetyl-beta-D-mannosaminyltransferase
MHRIQPPACAPMAAPRDTPCVAPGRESIVGYPVCTHSLDQLADEIDRHLAHRDRPRWVACLNPHSATVARDDAQFDRALHGADWVIPDGVGVVIASRMQRGHIRDRITGTDVFTAVNRRLAARGGSVFFLGSTPDNLEAIRARLAIDFPGLRIAGMVSPPFRDVHTDAETDAMVAAINAARPDMLWVGMTAPKQEKWLAAHLHRLDVGAAAGIGAVFDFYTGRVRRSHPAFQRLGLEWLPRLLQQPGRLWRRTFVSAPRFLSQALLQSLRARAPRITS